ncbi:MAG: AraC family transcriptional regulator [Microbacterium sp.]
MATASSSGVANVLESIDVRVRRQRRFALADGESVAFDPTVLTLAYVITGALDGDLPLHRAPDVEGRCDRSGSRLDADDLLLVSGRRPQRLTARGPSYLLISELELADRAAHLASLLPETMVITGFAALEPAAAALAQHLGTEGIPVGPERDGDPVVCRMMAKTVLVSAIRAWAANGCAPAGWPMHDPFLDRVVAAIHSEPGREWTVDGLASVGAMSRTVFAERFRATYGRSPASYVTAVRMRAAQDLLGRGLGVSRVSRELGYGSDEGFSRAFRRHTGMTPSAWRSTQPLATA